MFLQTGAQVRGRREPRRIPGRDHDIHRRQAVLVHPEGLARETLDAIARHSRAEGARRNGQTQPWIILIIGQHRQTKISVGEFSAALPYGAKFGRLVQTFARLERQRLDWLGDRKVPSNALRAESLAALGTTTGQQVAAALGGHAGTKSMGTGTMQIAGIKSTFHSTASGKLTGANQTK